MRVGGQQHDEIHWHRELPVGNRAAGLRARQRLDAGARALVRAVALASWARVGYFGARHERQAETLLGHVHFDEPETAPGPPHGAPSSGRVLRVRAPALLPQGRAAAPGVTLHRALHATADAVRHFRATGGLDGFDAAVAHGASRELTEGLQQLVRGTEVVRIAVAWSPGAGTPQGLPEQPEPAVFTPADLRALERASRRYLDAEPSVPARVTGQVVRLRRAEPSGGGVVRLRVLAGVEVAQVRVRLEEEAYRLAVHAHLAGVPVVVEGVLESRTGFRRLSAARGLSLVPVGAERRGLLLSRLHDGVGAFAERWGSGCGE